MTPRAARMSAADGSHRLLLTGAALTLSLALLTWLQAPGTDRLQSAWFDSYQALLPRQVRVLPVTVVEIDQKSLAAIGQWPWPRTQLARLVRAINGAGAAAIGLNVVMPESDALSPERLLDNPAVADSSAAPVLRSLMSNDAVLAETLALAPAVLVVAGTSDETASPLRAAPVTVQSRRLGSDVGLAVPQYRGALTTIDELNRQASGWGLMSADTTRGIVRRIPLVASIQGTLVPTLAVEMIRVASRASSVRLTASGRSVTGLAVGPLSVRTERDGAVRVYFSRHRADRFVSAVDVIEGKVDPTLLKNQLVLIGPTAIGLQDFQDTPIGERMSGSEIQAQLMENLLGRTLLRRPSWAPLVEALVVVAFGALLTWAMTRLPPFNAAMLLLLLVALSVLTAFAAYRSDGFLLDAATPSLNLVLVFGVLLVFALTESTRHRRSLVREVHAQRERSARIAGELEAAQRVQTASLPSPDLLGGDRRADLHAALTPAREVGGDLYDFFMLDGKRLFLLIGDVSGKGLSASIFMAVSKALYKGSMVRSPDADIGDIMRVANAEVSRDNAEMLFVTMFAAILDLGSGELRYCNAGHENPYLVWPGEQQLRRIVDGDGPPLCTVEDYEYRSARLQLVPGALLCLMTDGVTDAQDASGALYGHARAERLIVDVVRSNATARDLVTALQADVLAFADGAEPHDDLTILAIRWCGPNDAAGVPLKRG